jgi:hypothetical protein
MSEISFLFNIATLIVAIISPIVAYRLGLKSQSQQALKEYVLSIVKIEYPELFCEIKRNLDILDDYLENPNENFTFMKLEQFYENGLEVFMKIHHNDLFIELTNFRRDNLPEFSNANNLTSRTMNDIYDVLVNELGSSLPKNVTQTINYIAMDLIKSINPNYVLPDLLNERYEQIRTKVERSIRERTSNILNPKGKVPYVIRAQNTVIDFDRVTNSLIEKAKPEINEFLNIIMTMKKKNTNTRTILLPLLQKYIGNPI